jgi:hypothetical protein
MFATMATALIAPALTGQGPHDLIAGIWITDRRSSSHPDLPKAAASIFRCFGLAWLAICFYLLGFDWKQDASAALAAAFHKQARALTENVVKPGGRTLVAQGYVQWLGPTDEYFNRDADSVVALGGQAEFLTVPVAREVLNSPKREMEVSYQTWIRFLPALDRQTRYVEFNLVTIREFGPFYFARSQRMLGDRKGFEIRYAPIRQSMKVVKDTRDSSGHDSLIVITSYFEPHPTRWAGFVVGTWAFPRISLYSTETAFDSREIDMSTLSHRNQVRGTVPEIMH